MFNLIKQLFATKKPAVQRVRNSNGMYARRIKINQYGQTQGYIYAASTKGFRASGRNQ